MALTKTPLPNYTVLTPTPSNFFYPSTFAQIITPIKHGLPIYRFESDTLRRARRPDGKLLYAPTNTWVHLGPPGHYTTTIDVKGVADKMIVTTYTTIWIFKERSSTPVPTITQTAAEMCFVPLYTCVCHRPGSNKNNATTLTHIDPVVRHIASPEFVLPSSNTVTCFHYHQLKQLPWMYEQHEWDQTMEYLALFDCASAADLMSRILRNDLFVADEEIDTANLKHRPHQHHTTDDSFQSPSSSPPQQPQKSSFKKKRKVHYADEAQPSSSSQSNNYTSSTSNDPHILPEFDENNPVVQETVSVLTWIWGTTGSVIKRLLLQSRH